MKIPDFHPSQVAGKRLTRDLQSDPTIANTIQKSSWRLNQLQRQHLCSEFFSGNNLDRRRFIPIGASSRLLFDSRTVLVCVFNNRLRTHADIRYIG